MALPFLTSMSCTDSTRHPGERRDIKETAMTRYDDRSPALPSTAAPARTTTTRLRPTRSLLALETRIVFDGAAPAAHYSALLFPQ